MATRPHTAGAEQKPGRIESLDLFRALAILAVVGIHVLGHFKNDLVSGGAFWYLANGLNRALQFAVPAFITLSAFLNIRPLMRGEDLGQYARRRLLRAMWPYVLWTVFYGLFRHRHDPWNLSLGKMVVWLLTGNAYYHLYFLLLVLQLYLVLPLLAPLFRRRPGFAQTAIAAYLIQAAIYALNRQYLWFHSPGSVIVWYLPSIALGAWLATHSDRLRETVRRGLPAAALTVLAVGAVYLSLEFAILRKQPINTAVYQGSLWIYAPASAFLLLGIAERLAGTAVKHWLDPLGERSLEIYLVHPMVIVALDRLLGHALPAKAAIPLYYVLCVFVPMGIAKVLSRLRLSRWVWGTDK